MSTIVDDGTSVSSNTLSDDGNIVMHDGHAIEMKLKEDRALTDHEIELVKQQRIPKKMWGPHNIAMRKTLDNNNEYFVILYSKSSKVRVYPIITGTTTYSDLRTVIAQCVHVDLASITFDNAPDIHATVGLESFAIIPFTLSSQAAPEQELSDDSPLSEAQRHPNYFDAVAYEIPVSDNPYVNDARRLLKNLKELAPEIALPYDNHDIRKVPIETVSADQNVVPETQRIINYDNILARFLEKHQLRFANKLDSEKILNHMRSIGYEVINGENNVQTTDNGLTASPAIVKIDNKYIGQMHESLIDDYLAMHVYFMPPSPEDRKFIEFTDNAGGRYYVDLVVAATEFCMLKNMVALPACDGTGGVSTLSFPFAAGENIVTAICDHLYYCSGFKSINEDWYEQDEQIKDVSKQLIPHWIPFSYFCVDEYEAVYNMSEVLEF